MQKRTEEEKNKKREYGKNKYQNMSEEKKTKIKKIMLRIKMSQIIMNKISF